MAEVEKRRIEDHAKIATATGLSISFAEFMSEYIARVAGVTEWRKFFTKAFVKTLIGGGFLYLAGKVKDAGLAFTLQLAGYSPIGTIVWDFINTLYPGGIWGVAEAAALKTRGGAKTTQETAKPIPLRTAAVQRISATSQPRKAATPQATIKGASVEPVTSVIAI